MKEIDIFKIKGRQNYRTKKKKFFFTKFNRRNKKELAKIILDRYERGEISFETLYMHFWRLLRDYKAPKKTWKLKG